MKFDNLTVTFGMQEIFKDVSLYIKPNETLIKNGEWDEILENLKKVSIK